MIAFKNTAIPAKVVSLPLSAIIVAVWTFAIPVVVLMKPVGDVVYSGSSVIGEFVGYKLRNCSPILGSERGLIKVNGTWFEDIPFEFVDDQSPGSSKPPLMRSYFGWWQWSTDQEPTHVMMQIDHLCGSRQTVSTFGPYEVTNE